MMTNQRTASRSRGFTLLELLVVIAIVGILAAVTLAALGSTRAKGTDANIKANLKNASAQAQLFYDLSTPNTYDNVCAQVGSNVAGRQVAGAERAYRGAVTTPYLDATPSAWDTVACHDSATAWAAIVPLSASTVGSPLAWCVDSLGASRQVTLPVLANITVCP